MEAFRREHEREHLPRLGIVFDDQHVAHRCGHVTAQAINSHRPPVVKRKGHVTAMSLEAHAISYADFDKIDIRVGRIVDVDDFPEARKPAYKLQSTSAGDRIQEVVGAGDEALLERRAAEPPGGRRRELPAEADWPVHVRGAHARRPGR